MEAAVWKDFPYYKKFEEKFDGKALGIVSALEGHYSNDGRFDGFFEDWCWLEEGQHLNEDQILEAMREKAAAYDKKAEDFFKRGMSDLAKAKGIGEKGMKSIIGRVYMESEDKQRHLRRNYMKLIEGGADKSKIDGLVMERFEPKNPGNDSFWGKLKKYGKKPVTWVAVAAVAAAAIGTCYFSRPEKYEQKAAKPSAVTEQLKSAVPVPPEGKAYKACFGGWGKTTAILPMPQGSHREGSAKSYKVVLPAEIVKEEGSNGVRIRQDVKPVKGSKVDKVGIRTERGWVYANPEKDIFVQFTPGELGSYLAGEGVDFQAAAFRRLHHDERKGCEILESVGSYRNGKIVKP